MEQEVNAARDRALAAGLATFKDDASAFAETLRETLMMRLVPGQGPGGGLKRSANNYTTETALQAARAAVLAMREKDEIGDDAFHRVEEDLDWLEMGVR